MTVTEQQLLTWLASFIWPFFRIGSMFISVPIFSGQRVPARIRVMLAVMITFVMMPVLPPMPSVALLSYSGLMIVVQQVFLGIATGFILQMVFSVMLVAGQSIAYSMGLGFASLVDPATGVQVPVVAQIFIISASLIFLAVNGHLILIEMLAQSFTTLPVGEVGTNTANLWMIVAWSRQIFVGGVSLALPVLATILFVNRSYALTTDRNFGIK